MSNETPAQQRPPARVPNGPQLIEQSRDTAMRLYNAVAEQYLLFRRDYFHDATPSLATEPPQTDVVQQTESGKIAEQALHLVPAAVRDLPLIRELRDHLQWEADIHTLTAKERLDLHNITMVFLYGVDGGIQPWYVEWLLEQMHRIHGVTHPKYYLAYPWQGLLYRDPDTLHAFDNAVRAGNVLVIGQHLEHHAGQLVTVLRDPLHTQPKLAFSGPHGEERRVFFNLKTAAAIALGAYLAAEAVRDLLGGHQPTTPPQSVLQPLPPQITMRMLPEGSGQ